MRRLVAKDYREAYDLVAREFDDPALMANRSRSHTHFKIQNLAAALPLTEESSLLDVGPGDGALFRAIAPHVDRCCGVDPSESAVRKLEGLFESVGNVEFRLGSCEDLPCDDASFDVVVINSVVLILPDEAAVVRTLRELMRVSRPGGTVFVGEVPCVPEGAYGVAGQIARKIGDSGLFACLRDIWEVYVRPVARGGPLLVAPLGRTLHFEPERFMEMCRREGVDVECRPHLEPRRVSRTRKDYVLTKPR